MAKFLFVDGKRGLSSNMVQMRGDVVHVLKDDHSFGTEELRLPLFACVDIPDLPYSTAVTFARALLPDNSGKYIERPSFYYVDIEEILGIDYEEEGVTTIYLANIIGKWKTRDPLLNPDYKGK